MTNAQRFEVHDPLSGQNWVGEVARAFAAVQAHDDEKQQIILRMLGLQRTAHRTASPGSDTTSNENRSPSAASAKGPSSPDQQHREPDTVLGAHSPNPMPLLTPLGTELAINRRFTEPVLSENPTFQQRPTFEFQPLLPPRSQSEILRILLSRVVREGPVDIERVVIELAKGAYIEELPRKPVRTLRFGVQVLADLGQGMHLFLRDQQELLNRVTAIVGRHACDVRYFAGDPRRTGKGARWSYSPLTAPARGTRVLIVSDFGQHLSQTPTRTAGAPEWQEAYEVLHRGGCLPIALTPLPSARQPAWLKSMMPVLTWDRTTTAAAAHTRTQ